VPFARVGTVTNDDVLKFRADGSDTVFALGELVKAYKSTLAGI